MIREDPDGPGFLRWGQTFALTGMAAVVFITGVGVLAWFGDPFNAAVMAFSLSMAMFSLGRLWQMHNERHRRAYEHGVDSCVEAGEHVPGCIFYEDPYTATMEQLAQSSTMSLAADSMASLARAAGQTADVFEQRSEEMDAISMCMECSALLDDSRDQSRHQGRMVERCLPCSQHSLCVSNPDGPHERVLWPEDPDFDSAHVEGYVLPADVRVGYCEKCRQPFWTDDSADDPFGTFYDLQWEDVGRIWAERTNPALLEVGERKVEIENVDIGNSDPDGLTVLLWDRERGRRYAWSERQPLSEKGRFLTMARTLGFQEGDTIDGEDLIGKTVTVVVGEHGEVDRVVEP